jgi:hypothetical protein
MDALDNIDLDDMFAEEGDALFDGLDIDIDMDDITGGPDSSKGSLGRTKNPLETPASTSADDSLPRRKTKRKTKAPAFFEDDDDIYEEPPAKKKKRASKAASPKGKKAASSSKKAVEAVPKPPPKPASKKGKVEASVTGIASAPLSSTIRGQSGVPNSVAASGQFGGRQKRGASLISKAKTSSSSIATSATTNTNIGNSNHKLPLQRTSTELLKPATSSASRPTATSSFPTSAAATLAQIKATHPGLTQSGYCGLPPSKTLFYPFMPALPNEPSLKSRKIFSLLDRIHSSFTGHLASAPAAADATIKIPKENEAIFQLVQEALKEEKPSADQKDVHPNRSASVGHAIGTIRKTITNFEKPRLAADLLAVCALLQRQHGFLKQNLENMERWCKTNFSEADYASVFLPPPKKKATEQKSILESFNSRELRVRIICFAFKEPRPGPLIATLPMKSRPPEVAPVKETKPKPTKKKKTAPNASGQTDILAKPRLKVSVSVDSKGKTASPIAYAAMQPAKRRKCIEDLLSRIARELENGYQYRLDIRRQALDRQESEIRKTVEDDPVQAIHTMGMWKWLEKSAFFDDASESKIRQLLRDLRSPESSAVFPNDEADNRGKFSCVMGEDQNVLGCNDRMVERLQFLLVEETCDYDDASTDEEELDDSIFSDTYENMEVADTSELSIDERLHLHLDALGLAPSIISPLSKSARSIQQSLATNFQSNETKSIETSRITKKHSDITGLPNGLSSTRVPIDDVSKCDDAVDELEDVIFNMTKDLLRLNKLNNRRVSFLENVAKASNKTSEVKRKKQEQEESLIMKCQQMIRRTKEMKGKTGSLKKNDSLALPW